MILPTKHIPLDHSLLGLGAQILRQLELPKTVTALWLIARNMGRFGTFERFLLVLDLLFILDAITLEGGFLRRVQP